MSSPSEIVWQPLRLLFVWLGNRCGCPTIAPVATKPDMNGNGSKIEIFKPFGEAFELMKKILFQPFDLKKWLVIGFAAWLANLGAGGGGIGNFNYPDNRREDAQKLNETIGQIPQPVLITGICVLVCVVLLLIVLFAWLRARGRFIFVDCIVRNRAAIVEPWKEFRAEGNSFFLFSLLVVLVVVPVIVIAGLVLIVPFIPGRDQAEPGVAFWIGISLTAFISVCLIFVWALALSVDGPDHVSATLSRATRVCSNRGPGKLPSRADPALRFIPSAVSSRGGYD